MMRLLEKGRGKRIVIIHQPRNLYVWTVNEIDAMSKDGLLVANDPLSPTTAELRTDTPFAFYGTGMV